MDVAFARSGSLGSCWMPLDRVAKLIGHISIQPHLAFSGLISHISIAGVGPGWPLFEAVWAQSWAH